MIQISSPAMLIDMAELGGAQTRVHWGVVREMWRNGETWAVRADGDLVFLAGIYPISDTAGEVWSVSAPKARAHFAEILAAMRLTLQSCAYRDLVTVCRSRAGKVMARRMGFTFKQLCEVGEIWTWAAYSALEESATTAPRTSRNRMRKRNNGAV